MSRSLASPQIACTLVCTPSGGSRVVSFPASGRRHRLKQAPRRIHVREDKHLQTTTKQAKVWRTKVALTDFCPNLYRRHQYYPRAVRNYLGSWSSCRMTDLGHTSERVDLFPLRHPAMWFSRFRASFPTHSVHKENCSSDPFPELHAPSLARTLTGS